MAHVSDLHLGRNERTDAAARGLCSALVEARVDAVLVTGDVTHRGRRAELLSFEDAFEPLLCRGVVAVVPGNHDRAGDDAGASLMIGARVGVTSFPGLHVVRVDSTASHNSSVLSPHGHLAPSDLADVDAALDEAPAGALTAIMLHHHVLPLPPEDLAERLSGWLGWPHAAELPEGPALLALARGRCDLVLHGHRHVPSVVAPWPSDARELTIVNAGCSPDLGRARLYRHRAGALLEMGWLDAGPDRATARAALAAA
ncbi:MAG TPA: metallophosphoesterase [Anaeromyxobacter sp.]|nr:metallophosphoesterase [Anaeromyxobacter sp.]